MHDKIGAGLRLSCSYDEDVEAEKGVGRNGTVLNLKCGREARQGDALPRFSSHSQHASLVPPEAKFLNNERHGWLTSTPCGLQPRSTSLAESSKGSQ